MLVLTCYFQRVSPWQIAWKDVHVEHETDNAFEMKDCLQTLINLEPNPAAALVGRNEARQDPVRHLVLTGGGSRHVTRLQVSWKTNATSSETDRFQVESKNSIRLDLISLSKNQMNISIMAIGTSR